MPVDPSALADAGGWAVVVAVGLALGIGFVRRWYVPGWVYQQERDDREKAETIAARNAESLERIAKVLARDRGSRKRPDAPA